MQHGVIVRIRRLPDKDNLFTLIIFNKHQYYILIFGKQSLFAPFNIESVTEYTLGANEHLDSATRLQWNVDDYGRTKRGLLIFLFKFTSPILTCSTAVQHETIS